MNAISASARTPIDMFDGQGLANTAWAYASLKIDDKPLLHAIAAAAGRLVQARSAHVDDDERTHDLAFSILALAWAFGFLPPFNEELRKSLWTCLMKLGRRLDWTAHNVAGCRVASKYQQKLRLNTENLQEPVVLISGRGMLVICKPPGWEVDSVDNETDAACLSSFLQKHFARTKFPLLHSASLGHGFVHRLDVASSGLVLVGSTFEGLFALQWQKNLYEIHREYKVVSHDLEAEVFRDVDSRVNVLGTKTARTITEDSGQPALSHLRTHAHLSSADAHGRYCIILIHIYTGRRHQIRAHTRAIGHPTACDGWYAPSSVLIRGYDQSGVAPPRRWVRTPRWDGELPPPPEELNGHVY